MLISPLVFEWRRLLKRVLYKTIKHMFRKANQCVHVLAIMGQQNQSPLSFYSSPPVDMVPCLGTDVSFGMFTRNSASNLDSG